MTRRKDGAASLADRGRKGKAASPWSKGPHARTQFAERSYLRYRKAAPTNGK